MSQQGKKIKTAGSNIISNNIKIINNPENITKGKNITTYSNNTNNSSYIPKNKTPNNAKNRRIKPSTTNLNQRENNILLMQGSTGIQGNGLWCQMPKKKVEEDKPYVSIIPQIKEESKFIYDTEKLIDKKLIENLKSQVIDLTSKLQEKIVKLSDAEFRAERSEKLKKIIEDDLKSKISELSEYKESAIDMKNDNESLNEALNSAKKEIARLQNELNIESSKNKELNNKLSEFMIDKDKNNHLNSEEISKLQNNISKLQNEKANLIKMIQEKNTEISTNFNEEDYKQKLLNKEKILKTMETTMNKLLQENAELKKRLLQEDQNKAQLNSIINKKNNVNEDLKAQIESMKTYIDNHSEQNKWNKVKINQKDSNIKVMKDKLTQKDEEIAKLNKKIENLNKKLKINKSNNNLSNENDNMKNEKDSNTNEILVPVKAKPQLFGPETNVYDYQDADLEKDIFG